MLQSLLLEGPAGPRAAAGSISGAIALLQRAILQQQALQQPCRELSYLSAAQLASEDRATGTGQSCCSTSSSASVSAAAATGPLLGGLKQQLLLLLQQRRGISTSATSSYKFQSNLTRYNKSKVLNRDNFQRWRESGRDVRVAQDILREAGDSKSAGRSSSRRRGAQGSTDVLSELRSMVLECRDLQEMQVVVRECGRDLDAFLVCTALARLHKLKQATPASASPSALARRVGESLMVLLQEQAQAASMSSLATALNGLAECGLLPGRALMEAVVERVQARSPRGSPAGVEADPRTVGMLLLATSKFLTLQRKQQQQGVAGSRAAGEGAGQAGVLEEQLWPAVRAAAEAKLLRALGEEPEGAAAAPVGGEGGPEVDDSMPQGSLRAFCKALSLAHDAHSGVWTAAARLAARHAAELQPEVAASVLRSYAAAGGVALDGGQERLVDAVWTALEPRLYDLDVTVIFDLSLAAVKIAATTPAAAGGDAAAAADPVAAAGATAKLMLGPICDALTPRVPSLSCNDVAILATGLAEAYGGISGGAQRQPYGALPRLLADMLLLRGLPQFGARHVASVALALGLMGHTDRSFWSRLAAATLPEVSRMDGTTLSRLLGAFHNAAAAASAASQQAAAASTAAAPAASTSPAAAAASALSPGEDVIAVAHARVMGLLQSPEGVGHREAFHMLRALAEWPLPAGGEATLARLADSLVAAPLPSASPAVQGRLAAAMRGVGLGEHPLVAQLEGGR